MMSGPGHFQDAPDGSSRVQDTRLADKSLSSHAGNVSHDTRSFSSRETSRALAISTGTHVSSSENAHSAPKPTQADRDHAWFTSKQFHDFLLRQDGDIVKYAQWQQKLIVDWKEYADRRSDEVRYQKERRGDIEKDLTQARREIHKLQKEALASVDRFQPTSDGDISSEVESIGRAVDKMINHVCKAGSCLSSDRWVITALKLVEPHTIRGNSVPDGIQERTLYRVVLRNILWKFLLANVFQNPFAGFFNDAAASVERTYRALYSKFGLSFESNKWRSLSAIRLQQLDENESSQIRLKELQTMLIEKILKPLGYEVEVETLASKIRDIVAKAASFWQMVAWQRAFFEFKFSVNTQFPWGIDEDQNLTEQEVDKQEAEGCGNVWLQTRPALTKRGDGHGLGLDRVITIVNARVVVVENGADGREQKRDLPGSWPNTEIESLETETADKGRPEPSLGESVDDKKSVADDMEELEE